VLGDLIRNPNALRALVAKAKRIPVTDCLVMLGAAGAAAQCGACSVLESGVVHVSGRYDMPRAMARQQETLRFYLRGRRPRAPLRPPPPPSCAACPGGAGPRYARLRAAPVGGGPAPGAPSHDPVPLCPWRWLPESPRPGAPDVLGRNRPHCGTLSSTIMPSSRLWTTPFPSETIDRDDTHVTEEGLADDTSAAPFQQPDIVCFPEHSRRRPCSATGRGVWASLSRTKRNGAFARAIDNAERRAIP
jgi:hypothetical protein